MWILNFTKDYSKIVLSTLLGQPPNQPR
jgi:hypothetical protein